MLTDDLELIERGTRLLAAADWPQISAGTRVHYRAAALRVEAAWDAATRAGVSWNGLGSMPGASRGNRGMLRAAWTRWTYWRVTQALRDIHATRSTEAVGRLRRWLPQAEGCPPRADIVIADARGGGIRLQQAVSHSKRRGIHRLPDYWLQQLWAEAVRRDCKHLDALAACIVSGCRPVEICRGVEVSSEPDGILCVTIPGAKVSETVGQPWRKLRVGTDDDGPVHHLLRLANRSPEGVHVVKADCSPNALSMAVADLGRSLFPGQRISTYDVRHQRSADVKNAFRDADLVAAWMGHAATDSARYYGRLPRSAGTRGPVPLSAEAPRLVRHPAPRAGLTPAEATAP